MKDLITTINEGKYCSFFSEIQNETSKNGEYHTFDYNDGIKKYKKGFFYLNDDEAFMGFIAFKNIKEYTDENGLEPKYYTPLDEMNVGDVKIIENDKYIRIW